MKLLFSTWLLSFYFISCNSDNYNNSNSNNSQLEIAGTPGKARTTDTAFFSRLASAALALTAQTVNYDPTYFVIPYPNGDVPANKGVCTDVIIRAYRKLNIDLQKEVHEDMAANFSKYPRKWNLTAPDKNIDHRRVPNLMTFFERRQSQLPVTTAAADYKPGDIVCWMLPGSLTHIGIVIDALNEERSNYLMVHNIGRGQEVADCLFSYQVIGHYRYRK